MEKMAPQEEFEILMNVMGFLAKRQMQGRPTTLRQMSKRVGRAIEGILSVLDKNEVEYVLVKHPEHRTKSMMHTEILIRTAPGEVQELTGVLPYEIEDSFKRIMGNKPETVTVAFPDAEIVKRDKLDPYAPYRITSRQYEVLKKELIPYKELEQIARERGYNVAAIRRAVGGDRMRNPLAGEFWRPYVLGKKRYYLREVLKHLEESDETYKSGKLREKKKLWRKQRRRTNFAKKVLEKESA